tara:strand:- start:7589 stop:7762 length:174 start_codon:yes stop_codon:yes gene_type:complete
MQKIVILNFESGEVIIRNYPIDLEDSEDWFNSQYNDLDIRASDCEFMVVDNLIINSK